MDPRLLFPLLAAGFVLAAAVRWRWARRFDPAVRTWATLALLFGLMAAWLSWVR